MTTGSKQYVEQVNVFMAWFFIPLTLVMGWWP